MTTPIGPNQPSIDFTAYASVHDSDPNDDVANSDEVKSAVSSRFNQQVREAARELIDQLRDDAYWDAKMDGVEDRTEKLGVENLREHLAELGIIANKAGVLESLV